MISAIFGILLLLFCLSVCLVCLFCLAWNGKGGSQSVFEIHPGWILGRNLEGIGWEGEVRFCTLDMVPEFCGG